MWTVFKGGCFASWLTLTWGLRPEGYSARTVAAGGGGCRLLKYHLCVAWAVAKGGVGNFQTLPGPGH